MRDDNEPAATSNATIEFTERPWIGRFWFAVALASSILITTPFLSRALDLAAEWTRKTHIDSTVDGPRVRNLERVAFSTALRIDHPYKDLEHRTRSMLFVALGSDESTNWRAFKAGPNVGHIATLPLFTSLAAHSFDEPLSALRFFGYADEEWRLWNDMSADSRESLNEFAQASWVEAGYAVVAERHFDRNEYFLGMAAVEEGIKRARVRKLGNLRGHDGLTKVISPLLLIEAYFPFSPDEPIEPGRDLIRDAQKVLGSEFDALAAMNRKNPSGLYAYADGVAKLNGRDFAGAERSFSALRDQETIEKRRRLAAFMAVRSSFWWTHEELVKLRSDTAMAMRRRLTIEAAADRIAADTRSNTSGNANMDRLARLFAKALAEEMGKIFGRRAPPPPPPHPPPPAPAQSPQGTSPQALAAMKTTCALGKRRIDELLSKVGGAFWQAQASDYATALKAECDEVK